MPPVRNRDRLFPSMHTVLRQADSLTTKATIYYQYIPLPSFVFRYEPYGHDYFNRNHPLMVCTLLAIPTIFSFQLETAQTATHDGYIDWDDRVYFTVALPQPTKEEVALEEALLEPEPPRAHVRRLSVLVIDLALAVTRRLHLSRLG
ncbi:uncharacterized protein EV420DRAFT_1635085 [Desarmillaria tabescens]|uniref:Uncharacterized protein n=1 Tax=Armillaria tabescens TaxID=1929756 RepID=A0AA39NLS3_ARMTA|nr:uncharacterized protein EV420DRAFT_1635085 [Desarmillaria tabescens]KAK0467813.1 hypothetical protein EV420DRAFT_1635085 [Desarmillaria tabescens]